MIYVIIFITISLISGFLITYFIDSEFLQYRSHTSNINNTTSLKRVAYDLLRSKKYKSQISINNFQFSILERLAYSAVIGLGLSTWIVYIFSLFFGLQFKSIFISIILLIIFCLIFLFTRWSSLKLKIRDELINIKNDYFLNKFSYFVHLVILFFFGSIFFGLFSRIIIWQKDGMYVGLLNNFGDLPLHLSYITSFAWGNNIPPQDPSYAGEKLVYPILSDFLSAIFLKLGLGFKGILFLPGFLLTIAFYGVLYYFVYRLTKKRVAAAAGLFLFFFSGGFGFYYFFQEIANGSKDLIYLLTNLPRDYTKIPDFNYHWITPLTSLNVPQRPFLFGFPITIMIFSVLYRGIEHKRQLAVGGWQLSEKGRGRKTYSGGRREFLFAGILAGLLPFYHTHSFLVVVIVTIPLAIIFWDYRKWSFFFITAFILSLPQIAYFFGHVSKGSFFKYNIGWMAGDENIFWFWLKNTGIFWIIYISGLIVVLLFKRIKSCNSSMLYFSLPFLVLFFLPNIMLFAPWNWDNIKLLIYWFLGSVPLVAFTLSLLYENVKYKILSRVFFFTLLFFLTIAGSIDVYKYAIAPVAGWKEFSHEEVGIGKYISINTRSDAIFLNAPVHNHPVFLSGRKSLMGYPGHIWSHGYKGWQTREKDVKKMIKGKSNVKRIDGKLQHVSVIEIYKPDYAIVGPHEYKIGVNKRYFDHNYECVMTTASYNIYDLNKKLQINEETIDKNYGLSVTYYSNIGWQGDYILKEVDREIFFNWPNDAIKPIESPFSAKWEGYIDIQYDGMYTFKLISDDGSWLYIDDEIVVNNGGYHAVKSSKGSINLINGKHKILIKYFDGGGGAMMELLWTPPGGNEVNVPSNILTFKD